MKDIAGIQNAIRSVERSGRPYLPRTTRKKAYRYLKAQRVDLNVNLDALEAEYSKLQADHAAFARQLEQVQSVMEQLRKKGEQSKTSWEKRSREADSQR